MDRLFAAGALDVWITPIHMKKNRPGVLLSCLCAQEMVDDMAGIIFRETSAFGLRLEKVVRLKLDRRFESVSTEWGPVIVKLGLKDGQIVQASPEFSSCREVSEQSGQPLRAIYEAANRAWATQSASAPSHE